MTGRLAAALVVVIFACGGGSELADLAADTCEVLADPGTSVASRSLVVRGATTSAMEMGFTEHEFLEAIRAECGDTVIVGDEP
ncbi:MAG TPA: hypothetical protein VK960_04900 [Acidimicrobiia bacterium]|nr:hypothetical protein [Acidimicrobiia bacterium]